MKVVLDTNVLLAAFGARGVCETIYETCLDRHEIVTSEFILGELSRHLVDRFRVPAERQERIVALVRQQSTVVEPASVPDDACRDVDDLPILGTAVAGQAEAIVTGDRDLLTFGRFGETEIVSPREFHDRFVEGLEGVRSQESVGRVIPDPFFAAARREPRPAGADLG